jgi:hypothetical protein
MTTQRATSATALTSHLASCNAFGSDPFVLADVGVSGGIHSCWQAFGSDLRVFGFDPLIGEIERLRGQHPGGSHVYVAAKVGCIGMRAQDGRETQITGQNDHCYSRLASFLAESLGGSDAIGRYDQSGQRTMSSDMIELDQYFLDQKRPVPNFIKTDTDQFDIDVLRGAKGLLKTGGLLGISVEAYFVGNIGPDANVFSNIDNLLRSNGFTLFELDPVRYSRAALPAPFLAPSPCQSQTGQVTWAEAVYFRDLAHPDYEAMWGITPTAVDVLKLACLFDLFSLPDCAADVLVKYKSMFDEAFHEKCLDCLTPTLGSRRVTRADFLASFERYVRSGYDQTHFPYDGLPPNITHEQWLDLEEKMRLKDEIIASLKGIVAAHEESIGRMQARETERLRQELRAQGLLKE